MQVKVFNKNSALLLEQEINDWLAKNPDVEIRFSNQSQSRQSELGASLTSEMLPDTLLVAVGAKCTLKVLDCPGGRVSGKVSPLMLKPAPVKVPCAMVKLALPELVKVRFCTPVLPTSTLPKLTLGGATES